MMKRFLSLALIFVFVFILSACQNNSKNINIAEYNHDAFYRNDLLTVGADPSVIYINEGKDAGYYYMYATSNEMYGTGFLAYKSNDLINWECQGVALKSKGKYIENEDKTIISFGFSNYWAPEVIYDANSKLYYMFYSANRYDTAFNNGLYFFGDIAVSEDPAGPFVQYNEYYNQNLVLVDKTNNVYAYEPVFDFSKMSNNHPLYEINSDGYIKIIDLSPFIDPKTGNKYVYFCHDLSSALAISKSQIYVMALDDNWMPKYDEVYALTMPNRYTLDGDDNIELNEGKVNEAPFMVYRDGKYYLLYSANSYMQKTYSVRVAIADSPVGPFRKLTKEEGGYLLYADSYWTWSSGTGHCSVVNKDGQDYIVYHEHQDRTLGNSSRSIAVDEIAWTKNNDGLNVMVANGPSYAVLPKTSSKYMNIAKDATIEANKALNSTSLLNDGVVKYHDDLDFINECRFEDGSGTISLKFDDYKNVYGITIYNSCNYDYMFSKIENITLKTDKGDKKLGSLTYNWNDYYTEEGFVIPGGNFSIGFKQTKVNEIIIELKDIDFNYAISEIAVLGDNPNYIEVEDTKISNDFSIEVLNDDTVVFDGTVNKEEYNGQQIKFSDTNGVVLTMYSKMADNGLFVGFKSNDKNVYYNEDDSIFNNTSVELQLALGGTSKINANVLQLRYGVNGNIESWIGLQSAKTYGYMLAYVETTSKVKIYGDLNSSNCDGYDIEAYIPYSSLGLDHKPDSLICTPSFNTRKDKDASGRTTWTILVGSSLSDPTSWYRIDSDGQTVMTDGFNVSNNKIIQRGGSNQFYYFNDELLDAYYLNIDVKIGDILNNDLYPKFGVVNKSYNSLLGYYFDIANRHYNSAGRIYASTTEFMGTNWAWEDGSSKTFGLVNNISNLSINRSINIELIKYYDQYALLVDGKYVLGDVGIKGLEDGSIPGLFFFNNEADIIVNVYENEADVVKNYLETYIPNLVIDADLSDWDLDKTLINTEKDNSNGNQMTTYAFEDNKGIYVAYEVIHKYNPKVYMWNLDKDERGVWYYNTNVEFFINNEHFAATTFGDSGFMLKSMKTNEDMINGTYTTIFEGFIPKDCLMDKPYNIGFAFKTCDKDYENPDEIKDNDMKFNNDPWWFFSGHFPTDISKRWTIN